MKHHIRLTPFDTCFFRDGRPFTSGEQNEAAYQFPPFPSTLFGALRSVYIGEKGWDAFLRGDLRNEIGTKEQYATAAFRLKGLFLEESRGKIYLPLPCDLVADKVELKSKDTEFSLYPLEREAVMSNSPLPEVLMNVTRPGKSVEYPSGGAYIQQRLLRDYLLGQPINGQAVKSERFFDIEPKVGIARNSVTQTTEEGHLYQLNMIRLKQGAEFEDRYHFLADVEGIDFPNPQGMLKFGGESKTFAYTVRQHREFFAFDAAEQQRSIDAIGKAGGLFKLYFATPVIWNNAEGWRASWMNLGADRTPYPLKGASGKDLICQLITAGLGSHQLVGGWDIQANRPKTMRRAVPAGAVYYLKLLSGDPDDLFGLFHAQNLDETRAQEGFGLAYLGLV